MSETNDGELDLEASEADVAEQHAGLLREDDVPQTPRELPFDANEADAADQDRFAGLDEDDYR